MMYLCEVQIVLEGEIGPAILIGKTMYLGFVPFVGLCFDFGLPVSIGGIVVDTVTWMTRLDAKVGFFQVDCSLGISQVPQTVAAYCKAGWTEYGEV